MPDAGNPSESVERDSKTGRFVKGNRGGPGRPSRRTLTEALREVVDPEEAARMLWRRAQKSDALLQYVYDRIEGKARQSIDMTHKEDAEAFDSRIAEKLEEPKLRRVK